jgi:hypothetical protein
MNHNTLSTRARAVMRAGLSLCGLGATALAAGALFQLSDRPAAPGKAWTPNLPVTGSLGPSLRSAPSLGAGGGRVMLAWTDSRNTIPDIYSREIVAGDDAGATERRLSDPAPRFDPLPDDASAMAVEPSGRAVAAYTDGENVMLARYDASARAWVSHTLVTPGNLPWFARPMYPTLASDGSGAILVAWEDYRNADPSNPGQTSADIYAARCQADTMACATSIKLDGDATPGAAQQRPKVARRGSVAVAAWEDERDGGPEHPQVFARLSTDGGATWSPAARVSLPGGGSGARPAVAIDASGAAWVAWEQRAGPPSDPAAIYAARWNGAAWASHARVDSGPSAGRAAEPALAAGEAGVFAAWADRRNGASDADIIGAQWTGSGWSEHVVISRAGAQTHPALAVDGAQAHAAWQDAYGGPPIVALARWDGAAWGAPAQASPAAERQADQMYPSLARDAASGAAYLTWLDLRESQKNLWMSRLDPDATFPTWSAPQALPTEASSGSDIEAQPPATAVDGQGRLHAMWSEYRWPRGYQIYHSVYSGTAWSDPAWVAQPADEADDRARLAPAMAARGDQMAAAWVLAHGASWPYSYTIQAAWFDGARWLTPTEVLAQPVARSVPRPSVAIDGAGVAYIAWTDYTNDGARGDIRVARFDQGAGQWVGRWIVNAPPASMNWCYHASPQLAADGAGRLRAVWVGCSAWIWRLYASASADGGATWTSPSTAVAPVSSAGSLPALARGPNDELAVLYPAGPQGAGLFHFARLAAGAGAWEAPQRVSDGASRWLAPGEYGESGWYEGDSAGSIVYDAQLSRYVAVFPDRRGGLGPRLYSSALTGFHTAHLPVVVR